MKKPNQTPGGAFRAAFLDAYESDGPVDLILLDQAAALLDEIAALTDALERDGVLTTGSHDQPTARAGAAFALHFGGPMRPERVCAGCGAELVGSRRGGRAYCGPQCYPSRRSRYAPDPEETTAAPSTHVCPLPSRL